MVKEVSGLEYKVSNNREIELHRLKKKQGNALQLCLVGWKGERGKGKGQGNGNGSGKAIPFHSHVLCMKS